MSTDILGLILLIHSMIWTLCVVKLLSTGFSDTILCRFFSYLSDCSLQWSLWQHIYRLLPPGFSTDFSSSTNIFSVWPGLCYMYFSWLYMFSLVTTLMAMSFTEWLLSNYSSSSDVSLEFIPVYLPACSKSPWMFYSHFKLNIFKIETFSFIIWPKVNKPVPSVVLLAY